MTATRENIRKEGIMLLNAKGTDLVVTRLEAHAVAKLYEAQKYIVHFGSRVRREREVEYSHAGCRGPLHPLQSPALCLATSCIHSKIMYTLCRQWKTRQRST